MDFGKNRVQYNDFYWSFYRFDKFDTYFNQDGEPIARFTGKYANNEIQLLEERLNHKLNKRLIFMVYNKFSDFKQSNVGLVTGRVEHNTGGVTQIRNNKVSLYYKGDHNLYLQDLRASISKVIIQEILYGHSLSENLTSTSMLSLPDWYIDGLVSYLSNDWDIDLESKIKDGIENNTYKNFNRLTGENALYAGHSFWKYINDYYGSNVISDILYLTRVNKNANNALYGVLGIPFKEVSKQWLEYYQDYFKEDLLKTDTLSINEIALKKKNSSYISKVKISPNENYIAFVNNIMGQYKVGLYNLQTNKSQVILKHGHKIKQIIDYSYPVIEWHPTGKSLTIITEKEGGLKLYQYLLENKELIERNLLYFDKILDFSYSDDASKIVFSAVKDSKTDIYIYDIASATSEQITNDVSDEFDAKFIENSTKILFTSNRTSDSLNTNIEFGDELNLFTYNLQTKGRKLQQLTDSKYQNESIANLRNNSYLYLSDKSGTRNLYKGNYDSTISFIDTAIHYRYFLNQQPITNFSNSVIDYSISNNKFVGILFNNSKRRIIYNDLNFNGYEEPNFTDYRKKLNRKIWIQDSLEIESKIIRYNEDSVEILSKEDFSVNINKYVFEIEKEDFQATYNTVDTAKNKDLLSLPKIRIYQRTFYTDHVVSQVDFSFLSNTYQAFTGGAVYFNPGFNALLKIGANDMFEDYKLIAGVRFSADFHSNEFLISVENLKRKIDEQIVYHRQSFQNITEDFVSKTHTNKLMYIRTLPFSQVSAIKGTATVRSDRFIYLSTDHQTLQQPDAYKFWGGLKADYIYDNTINKGINLYNGTRFKLFAEYYNQFNQSKSDLYVVGADFRHYLKIHRDLILASRFAASTSFGNSKLIYYLGGVDNWTNFSQATPTFIPLDEIRINENENYAYQAVATNLRGFPQNIRNGNSFALVNTELRLPVVKYFSNYPLNSTFWSSIQLVGFFDIGTAWSGLSPYDKENAYDYDPKDLGSIVVTIDTERDPIVAGYGFGLRTMIFGYFTRFDWAWGIENQQVNDGIFYFSLSLDF